VSRGRFALLFVALLLGSACSGADDAVDASAPIEGFDTSPGAGFWPRARLNLAIVRDPAATHDAALDLLDSEERDVRVAAVYVVSVTAQPEDAEALAPFLASSDDVERVLAAAGMLALEDARAVPILIEALGVDAALPFGAPPALVWEMARFALLQTTGQDLGLRGATTAAEAAAAITAWESWWADAEPSFQFVPVPDPVAP
jgi:hypothetical protein